MKYQFLNIFLEQSELLAQAKTEINPFLLENNTLQLEKIYDFYKGNQDILYVNGFSGTGKAKIIDLSRAFLSSDAVVLKYNCFNSTVLDDVLLSFFVEFKKLSAQKIISEPKVRTENFTQKVNSYFSQIEKPFVVILDSFDAVLDENKQEIVDFILHLSSMDKVKVVVIARVFEGKYFSDVKIERVSTYALERNIFDKYLKVEKIKASSGIFDEFYKHTRGYFFFTELSLKLMEAGNLQLVDFLVKLKESYLSFPEFLAKQALEKVPANSRSLFWLLALVRNAFDLNLLKKLNLYDEEKIDFFKKNLLLIQDGEEIYVPDFFKEYVDDSSAPGIFQRIRQYIVDLYSTQLPLKPMERDICISRQTMRKEIEYHNLFLPRKPKNIDNKPVDINYLSYSKIIDFSEKPKDESKEEVAVKKSDIDLTQRKNIQINLENLPYQEKAQPSQVSGSEDVHEERYIDLKSLVEEIKLEDAGYNYQRVIELCKRALLMRTDSDYQHYLPMIYTRLAHACQKLADYENSLKYYQQAFELYEEKQDFQKVNYIKFNQAKIYYETYKIERAKELFLEIANSQKCPVSFVIRAYLEIANIEEGLSNQEDAFEYYKKAVSLPATGVDEEVLSELYFKYALALDDKNDVLGAIEYYNKCIDLGGATGANKFLSSAYSNIANLYSEKSDIQNASLNYLKAFEIDKKSDNLEGMYYSASKLATLLQRKDPDKALEHFKSAYDCALRMNDVFYIVSAALAFGDYYYDRKQNEFALRYYIKAMELARYNMSQDNINKIDIRLNDIKFRLGVEKYEKLVEIIKDQSNE